MKRMKIITVKKKETVANVNHKLRKQKQLICECVLSVSFGVSGLSVLNTVNRCLYGVSSIGPTIFGSQTMVHSTYDLCIYYQQYHNREICVWTIFSTYCTQPFELKMLLDRCKKKKVVNTVMNFHYTCIYRQQLKYGKNIVYNKFYETICPKIISLLKKNNAFEMSQSARNEKWNVYTRHKKKWLTKCFSFCRMHLLSEISQ